MGRAQRGAVSGYGSGAFGVAAAQPIVADWPEDIALFAALLVTGPGVMAEVPSLRFQFMPLSGFSTAANSKVPHNALHDARALRDHVLSLE